MKHVQVNVHEAKTRLSQLMQLVISGEATVTVAKSGKPLVDLTIHKPDGCKRSIGGYESEIDIASDCFDMDAEMADSFEGNAT